MWSKKWYLKRNISCDVHLLNELLETDVSWDDAIVVSAGKLRKLWDTMSELRSSLCERRLERTVLRPALLSVKTAKFNRFFFSSGMTSQCKIVQYNYECIGCLTNIVGYLFSMTLTPDKSNLHILMKISSIWRITYCGRTYYLSPKRPLLKVLIFLSTNWNKSLIVNRLSENWRSPRTVH